MSMMEKIKDFFFDHDDDGLEQESMSARAARLKAGGSVAAETPAPKRKIKGWLKSGLSSTPWLVFAIVLFAMFVKGAVVTAALGYGLLKVATAVVMTLMADETLFRSQKEPKQHGWVPMIRRATVFLGICWLMAVT